MIRARVKKWFLDRGFGFVVPLDGGQNIFVHIYTVPGLEPLRPGELVDIEYTRDDLGRTRATYLERVDVEGQ